MLKNLLYFFILTLPSRLAAQTKLLFDTSQIDANTKLVGRYPHYDKQQTYRYLNFLVEDSAEIRKIMSGLTLGRKEKNTTGTKEFRIALIKNFKEVNVWIVSPVLNSALYNGETYSFEVDKLKKIAKEYPFNYGFEKIEFRREEEYIKYSRQQQEKKDFLFSYAPEFRFEGSFRVEFPRDEHFSSVKVIYDYLQPKIEKIVSKDQYRAIYVLDQKNLKNQNQFTMTIYGSKKLYDSLELNVDKEEWTPTKEEGWFFYRVK